MQLSPTLLPEALLTTYQIIINSFLISFTSCGALPPVPASGGWLEHSNCYSVYSRLTKPIRGRSTQTFLEAELHLGMLLSLFQFGKTGRLDSQSGQSGTNKTNSPASHPEWIWLAHSSLTIRSSFNIGNELQAYRHLAVHAYSICTVEVWIL